MLAEAVEAGGSTLRDYAQTDGSLGYFQHSFRVYDREGERCATAGLRRHRAAARAVGPLDLLLPALPALSTPRPPRCRAKRQHLPSGSLP